MITTEVLVRDKDFGLEVQFDSVNFGVPYGAKSRCQLCCHARSTERNVRG